MHICVCVQTDGVLIYQNGSLIVEDMDYEGDPWMIPATRESHVLGTMNCGRDKGGGFEGDIAVFKWYDLSLSGEEVRACWLIEEEGIKKDLEGVGK